MNETINDTLISNFYHDDEIKAEKIRLEERVVKGEISSFAAGQILLDKYFSDLSSK